MATLDLDPSAAISAPAQADDFKLLRAFVDCGDEQAFTVLVHRHIGFVFSAAMRQVGNHHLAEEITQAVFVLLARKAASFSEDVIVSAWLFRASRLAASNVLRAEFRRKKRETEAMREEIPGAETEASWAQVAPFLDEAIGSLNEADRTAICLRFFEGKNLSEIGQRLGITHEAAKKRVSRALGKLQVRLQRREVVLSSVALGSLLAEKTLARAPEAVVAATVSSALSQAPLTAAQISVLNAVSRGLRVTPLPMIVAGVLLVLGSAALLIGNYYGPQSREPLKSVLRQSQKALRAGDGAGYSRSIVFTEEEDRQLRPVIEECVRSEHRLENLLVSRFGRSAFEQLRWPFTLDEIPETEISPAVESFAGSNASLRWPRGGALTFSQINGTWKINLYSVPGEPLATTILGYNRKRAAMDAVADALQAGLYRTGTEALAAYRRQLY